MKDPHRLPFDEASFDVIVSTSCMEHDALFWLTFSEMLRVVKPGGFIYINAPSNGPYHGYPLDHWRFYPDAGRALELWSRKVDKPAKLIESFIGKQDVDPWSDNVMVYVREPIVHELPSSRLYEQINASNIRRLDTQEIINFCDESEDRIWLSLFKGQITELEEELRQRDARIMNLENELIKY